jgi:hypothetical protein
MPAVYVILGWLLGLLSPQIVELIQRSYRRRKIRESLFLEMEGLRRKLAATVFQVYDPRGMIDRPFLLWLKPTIGSFRTRRSIMDPQALSFQQSVEGTLALSDAEIRALYPTKQPLTGHLTLKKYTAPFLDSQITSLPLFSPEFQRLALLIHSSLAAINQEIETAWFNYTKTFDTTGNNYAIVLGNMNQASLDLAQICRDTCDDITDLLSRII